MKALDRRRRSLRRWRKTPQMRITELRFRLAEYFPDSDTYARDIVHSELGGQTVNQALAGGFEPGDIWKAVVRHNPEMPEKFR